MSRQISQIERQNGEIHGEKEEEFCNRVFKMCLVVLSWLVPLVWVLPMLDPCCRSQYYGGRIELVEMKDPELGLRTVLPLAADSTYDAIDMVFETLFYVPVLCMLNTFTAVMLYSQWNALLTKRLPISAKSESFSSEFLIFSFIFRLMQDAPKEAHPAKVVDRH
ncbi:unnamed protein product [Heligmosomoides polygyrus]|uniref:G_PROTEIN_RECEP_F1_2 domain-containing protein n=1 Tax=Heligmosomoides polygyrus TaxID=6339 RepID=A0A183FNR8_HELPZ|nr:unnamed protein product [Heligmosomoides polygyrus]